MRTSTEIDKLADALAKAQGEMKNPEKNKTAKIPTKSGSSYQYNYADLPAVFDAAKESLAKNGLAHIATIDELDKSLVLVMRLAHSSGQWIESVYPLPNGGDDKALAASITYGRRYLFTALTGIAADEDTDSQPEGGASYDRKGENGGASQATRQTTVTTAGTRSTGPIAPRTASPSEPPMTPEQSWAAEKRALENEGPHLQDQLPLGGGQPTAGLPSAGGKVGKSERTHLANLMKQHNWTNVDMVNHLQAEFNVSTTVELTLPQYSDLAAYMSTGGRPKKAA